MGNLLSSYFYYTSTNASKSVRTDFINNAKDVPERRLGLFYKKLSLEKREHLIDFVSHNNHTWNEVEVDDASTVKPNYLLYWQTLRPIIRATYEQNFPAKQVAVPVIHFRCSDAPFVRFANYHLTKAATVQWMAEQVKMRGYDKAIFLACYRHKSLDKNQACSSYAQFYAEIFKQNGVAVEMQCNSIYDDFATMVYSPLLVALNGSSYSFMAGISKDPATFITCNLGTEKHGIYHKQKSADWLMDNREPLLHVEVEDYYDVPTVLGQL